MSKVHPENGSPLELENMEEITSITVKHTETETPSADGRKQQLDFELSSIIGHDNSANFTPEVGIILDYLTLHKDSLASLDPKATADFDAFVISTLTNTAKDAVVRSILEVHGWNGKQFDHSNKDMDSSFYGSINAALSSLVLKHQLHSNSWSEASKGYENKELMTDEVLLKSFCPNILFNHLADIDSHQQYEEIAAIRDNAGNATYGGGGGNVTYGGSSVVDLNADMHKKIRPCGTMFSGACVLADISGFTRLSSQLCLEGVGGLEKLHHTVSDFLGKFVQIVYAHRGDVIAFAGDALICIFQTALDATNSSAGEMAKDYCSRAIHCAFALRDHSEHGLTAHIGVSCGDMSFANLGGHRNSWIYLLNGACIPELSECIDNAGSKEVVCTKMVYDAVVHNLQPGETIDAVSCTENGHFKIKSLDTVQLPPPAHSRFYEAENTPAVTAASTYFVPRPASEAVNSGTFHLLSELREVTTLFLKLDSYDPVANIDPLSLQSFFYMCQQALNKTGGFLRQFLIDDKGCVVIAMWGVPSFTYPHNGSRAVNCGMAIHAGTLQLGHKCSIGITTGHVFCGNVGSLVRRDFVGIGHTVNLAARLMCKAKGQIYIDAATFAYLPQEFRGLLRPTEKFTVKGIDHPIIAYVCDNNLDLNFIEIQKIGDHKKSFLPKRIAEQIVSHLDSVKSLTKTNRVATLLNNASTLDDLQAIMTINAAEKSHVHVIIVEGVSGSGKTAGAAYYKVHARRSHMRMRHIVAKPADEKVKYGTIRRLFMALLGPRALNADEQIQKSVLKRILRDVPWSIWTGLTTAASVDGGVNGSASVVNDVNGSNNSAVGSAALAAMNLVSNIPTNFAPVGLDKATRSKFITASTCSLDDQIYSLAVGLGMMSLMEFMCPTANSAEGISAAAATAGSGNAVSASASAGVSAGASASAGAGAGAGVSSSTTNANVDDPPGILDDYNGKTHLTDDVIAIIIVVALQSLISKTVHAILIEDVHYLDKQSWNTLKLLMEMPITVSICLTSRHLQAVGGNGKAITPTNTSVGQGFMGAIRKFFSGSNEKDAVIMHGSGKNSGFSSKSNTPVVGKLKRGTSFNEKKHAEVLDIYEAITRHPRTTYIQMLPLTFREIKKLMMQQLKGITTMSDEGKPIPVVLTDKVIQVILEISSGNIFWVREIANFIVEHGIEEFNKTVNGKEGEQSMNPLQVLVICRLEKLTTEQQVALRYAAVIGAEFGLHLLLSIMPFKIVKKIDNVMGALLNSSFIELSETDNEHFVFSNSVIHNIINDLTPPGDASKLHKDIAESIESSHRFNLKPYYARLAFHYGKACVFSPDDRFKAFMYYTKAADEGLSRAAYITALDQSQHAFELGATVLEIKILDRVVNKALFDLANKLERERVANENKILSKSVYLGGNSHNTNSQMMSPSQYAPAGADDDTVRTGIIGASYLSAGAAAGATGAAGAAGAGEEQDTTAGHLKAFSTLLVQIANKMHHLAVEQTNRTNASASTNGGGGGSLRMHTSSGGGNNSISVSAVPLSKVRSGRRLVMLEKTEQTFSVSYTDTKPPRERRRKSVADVITDKLADKFTFREKRSVNQGKGGGKGTGARSSMSISIGGPSSGNDGDEEDEEDGDKEACTIM